MAYKIRLYIRILLLFAAIVYLLSDRNKPTSTDWLVILAVVGIGGWAWYENRQAPESVPTPSDELPPISRRQLKSLFDYLDRPNPPPCAHTFAETRKFLGTQGLPAEQTIAWLQKNGAGCDCEVILNVEADWGEYAGRTPAV
jgi:hypothetical protein